MLGGVMSSLGFGPPTLPPALPPEVHTPTQLAEIIGGPGIFAEDYEGMVLPSGDLYEDVAVLVSDMRELLRAPGSPLVRPTEVAPMPTFSLPSPPEVPPADMPFRPQPVKVQPYCISQDPEADLRLGDASPGGGPVSGRTVLLLLLQKLRVALGTLGELLQEAPARTAGELGTGEGTAAPAEGSLGRLIGLMRQHDFPLRDILALQERFDAGAIKKDDLVAVLRQGQARGVPKEGLSELQREATAVLRAAQGGEGSGILRGRAGNAPDPATRLAFAENRLREMNGLLFDIARCQMRIALAQAQSIQV